MCVNRNCMEERAEVVAFLNLVRFSVTDHKMKDYGVGGFFFLFSFGCWF